MKKRMSFILLVLLIITVLPVHSMNKSFSDVNESDWFNKDLEFMNNSNPNIINGFPDGSFRPNDKLSAEQFIAMLIRCRKDNTIKAGEVHWSKPYIEEATKMAYLENSSIEDFNEKISREEMSVIISSFLKVHEDHTLNGTMVEIEEDIVDFYNINTANQADVSLVYDIGIITGYPDGSFKPKSLLSRAEGLTVLRRIMDDKARKPFLLSSESEVELIYHPETDTYSVEDPGIDYFQLNDFTPQEIEEEYKVDFSIVISVTSRNAEIIQEQHDITKAFLDKKVGVELSEEIMEYVRTKNNSRFNLPSKFYDWGGSKRVQVISYSGNALIQIAAWPNE